MEGKLCVDTSGIFLGLLVGIAFEKGISSSRKGGMFNAPATNERTMQSGTRKLSYQTYRVPPSGIETEF
jgi:hypothetical protein